MSYQLSDIINLGSLQCCLITVFLFMIPLRKKDHFLLRFTLCCLLILFLIPVINMYRIYTATYFINHEKWLRFFGILIGSGGDLFINILLISFLVFISCSIKFSHCLYCGTFVYLTQDIAYTIYVILFPLGANRGGQNINYNYIAYQILIMAIINIIFYFLSKRITRDGDYPFRFHKSLIFTLLIILTGRIIGTYARISLDIYHDIIFQMLLIYDVLLSISLLVIQFLQRNEEEYRLEAMLQKQLRNNQKNQYERLKENIKSVNHKYHDLKHILNVLKNQTKQKDLIRDLEKDLMVYDSYIDTGHEVLNVILSDIFMICHDKNIQWTCMADGKVLSFMDSVDLYIYISNALENAVENVLKVDDEKRFIGIHIFQKGKMVIIRIENSFDGEICLRDGIPETRKDNKLEHGFGIKSMKSIIEKYDGHFKIEYEEQLFSLKAIFFIK